MTRYLNGDRLPPWSFIAHIIEDIAEEEGKPVKSEIEEALRRLLEEAQQTNTRSHEIHALQERLALADEETRRIKTREKALTEALHDRRRQLVVAKTRCHKLEKNLELQKRAHQAEVIVWRGEYEKLKSEREKLQEEILHLQEALAVARAELIAAEEHCRALENELESAQESHPEHGRQFSLMDVLEATNRTATVPELVALVGDLETQTWREMATELVTSVSQQRDVAEVGSLLASLYKEGLHSHAEAAVPAMVISRPAVDTAALLKHLVAGSLEEPVAALLQASVRLHAPEDIAVMVKSLCVAGLTDQAVVLLGAAATVREVSEVTAVLLHLIDRVPEELINTAVTVVARERLFPELVDLIIDLHRAGLRRNATTLQRVAAAERPASDVAGLIDALLCAELAPEAHSIFWNAQERSTGYLVTLVSAMHTASMHSSAAAILAQAIQRPVWEIAALIVDLRTAGLTDHASDVLVMAVRALPAPSITQLIGCLDERDPWDGAVGHLGAATRVCRAQEAVQMLTALHDCRLTVHADAVFWCTVEERPTGHAAAFLLHLVAAGHPCLSAETLRNHAQRQGVSALAPFILAMDAAGLSSELNAVLLPIMTRPALDAITLMKQMLRIDGTINPSADRINTRLLRCATDSQGVADLINLCMGLEAEGMFSYSSALEYMVMAPHNPMADAFAAELRRIRRKHHPGWWTPAFWKDPVRENR
ncbi:hypothetical protein [Streptomyces hainanensis]|uniref:ATP/GTP-binding protein n=1 Tax=Streptomyces hainanensis TaxID=402648 RepID=A0A4V2Y3H6_9ACTN|nr:hypothetical protein [Streptomyces hainanensis]TDC76475.1 hypothetical protein E1283_09760 [Streptomyces hainanensis]